MSPATKSTEAVTQAVQSRRQAQRREALEAYRKFIQQSHDGKKLSEADTAKVVDAMNLLEIPTEAIDADVEAWGRQRSYRQSLADVADRRKKHQADCERLTTQINETRDKLRALEREHRVTAHEGQMIAALEGQANQHSAANPRLFADDIDRALSPPRPVPQFSRVPPDPGQPVVPYFHIT
ncbi:MAG: hypothetical protein SGJ19_05035 [Planctomycetia bacterium]|nr:hypothetical protein [Planctomycetia bacterium]